MGLLAHYVLKARENGMAGPQHARATAATSRPCLLHKRIPGSRRRLVAVVVLALSAAVGACTPMGEYIQNGFKVGPNYCKPPAPVADHWIDSADKRLRKESDDLSHWWQVFNDPILNSLVCFAYRQNLTLREAGFRVLQARAELGIATGYFFPQTQTMDSAFSQNEVSESVANRGATPQRFFQYYGVGFNIGWELDFWGRFRRAIEAADAHLNSSVEDYDDVLVTLLSDVAANYVQLRVLERQIDLVRVNVQLQRESLGIAQTRFKNGQTSELDVDQAQSLLSQTEAYIPELEISVRKAANRICVLLGIPPDCLMTKLKMAPVPLAPPDLAVGIPAELLGRRPDVRRAERDVAERSAYIGVAEADLYPAITLLGTIGVSADQFASLWGTQAWHATTGPAFDWKILNYGRIVNHIALEDARFQEKIATYQQTVLKAQEEVENGIVTFLQAHQRVLFFGESVEAALKAVKVALAQYRAGTVDFNRVALLEQNLVDQQNNEVQARGEIAQGLIQVYKALGGGWEIRLTGCDPSCMAGAGGVPTPAPAPGSSPVPGSGPVPALTPESLPAPKTAPPGPPTPPASRNSSTAVPPANGLQISTISPPAAPETPLLSEPAPSAKAASLPVATDLEKPAISATPHMLVGQMLPPPAAHGSEPTPKPPTPQAAAALGTMLPPLGQAPDSPHTELHLRPHSQMDHSARTPISEVSPTVTPLADPPPVPKSPAAPDASKLLPPNAPEIP